MYSGHFRICDKRYNTYRFVTDTGEGTARARLAAEEWRFQTIAPRKQVSQTYGDPPRKLRRVHLFHERCCAVVNKVLHADSFEKYQLLVFNGLCAAQPLWQRSVEEELTDECNPWVGANGRGWEGKLKYADSLEVINEATSWSNLRAPAVRYPPRDPLNIPELRDAILEAKERRHHAVGLDKRKEQSLEQRLGSGWYQAPYEIRALIFNYLETSSDINNAITVLGWHLDDAYWKQRFPKNLVFEYHDFLNDELDWKFLFTRVGDLQGTSYGLMNRRRIISILEHSLPRLYRFVEEHKHKLGSDGGYTKTYD